VPLVAYACLAYLSMALPDSMLGVAWPWMRLDLHQPVAAIGAVLPFGIAASVLASTATGRLLDRVGVGRLLAAGTVLSTVALALNGLARSLWVLVAAGIFLGLGSGSVDTALNAHAARRFGARGITWMHASYGLGATIGPLVVTAALAAGAGWRWAYALVAVAQAALAATFTTTRHRWTTPPPATPDHRAQDHRAQDHRAQDHPAQDHPAAGAAGRSVGRWGVLVLGVLVFVVHTGIESGVGLWGYVFLTSGRGVPAGIAGVVVSGYWATMFVGRLVLGPVAQRIGAPRVLAGAVAGVAVGAAVLAAPVPAAASGAVAVAGMLLIGLAAAPVFPLLTLTTADRVGAAGAGSAIGAQVAAATVGGAGLPVGMGLLMGSFGGGALAYCLVALAATLCLLYTTLHRRTPRP
jgi:fucose permease